MAKEKDKLEQLRGYLLQLKLPQVAARLDAVLEKADKLKLGRIDFLNELLGEEAIQRHNRAVEGRIEQAKFAEAKTFDTFDWKSIDCKGPNGEEGCNGGKFIESINFRHTSNEPGSTIGKIDPNLEPTQKHEYTIGLDRELAARMALGFRYVHKGWDQTIDDIGVCAPGS